MRHELVFQPGVEKRGRRSMLGPMHRQAPRQLTQLPDVVVPFSHDVVTHRDVS